ncbi:MAG: deoxyribonucleoside regulator [Kosmotogales bacterium]|nr:deoxyribonucleoside regulator [Kosmotogales bacterium]
MYSYTTLIKVAELYYKKKYSQKEISKELSVSVPTVSRMLQESIDLGIVQVKIVNIESQAHSLGEKIKEKYDIEEIIILETPSNGNDWDLKKLLGKKSSEFISDLFNAGEKVGIGPGSTMSELIESLSTDLNIPAIQILPIMGSWGIHNLTTETNKLVSSMARVLRTDYYLLPAPAIVSSENVKNMFLNEPQISAVTELWEKLDTVIFSIGPEIENSLFPTLTDNRDIIENVKSLKAVGDIAGRIINEDGEELDIDYNRRLISIPIDVLKKIPKRVGIGGGQNKYRSVKAALEAGIVNYLITDYQTCLYILENGGNEK